MSVEVTNTATPTSANLAAADQAEHKAAANDNREAPYPVPRPILPPPGQPTLFPIEALGPILAPAARAIASLVQAPDAMAGSSILAAAALAVQGHADVVLPHGQARPISCLFLTIAGSGERKSAVDGYATRPLKEFLREKLAEHEVAVATYKQQMLGSAPGQHAPEIPISQSPLMDDPTPEGIFRALSEGWPSQGLFSDEAGRFLGGHGMSLENRIRTSTTICKIWDGDPITRVRANEPSRILVDRRLSAHLMAQPGVAASLIDDPTMQDQGLTARFLITAPASLMGTRLFRKGTQEERDVVHRYCERLTTILHVDLPRKARLAGALDCRPLAFSPEAEESWIDYHNEVEVQLVPDGRLLPVKGLAGKLPEHVGRVAAVLALLEGLDAREINRRHMDGAVQLVRHYAAEALRLTLAHSTAADPALALADKFGRWLRSKHLGQAVSLTTIEQFGPPPVRKAETAHAMLAILEERGWVIRHPGAAGAGGRRKADTWEVVVPPPE